MADILLENYYSGKLRFSKHINVGGLKFNIAPGACNTWVFHAVVKTPENQRLAQEFAEDLGMAILLDDAERHTFLAFCTNDTYTYILPIKLDKWRRL